MTQIGDRLREARERKNLKQTQVRDKTGINNKTLSGYEKGVSEPDVDTLRKLADFYEVTTDWLTGNTNDPKPKKTVLLIEGTTDKILKEIVERYNVDLTIPGNRDKLEKIIQIVAEDFERKHSR